MNSNQKGTLLAIAAATLLASGFMASVADAKTHLVRCQITSESEGNTCGSNGCPSATKSTSVEKMTIEECKNAGGRVVK